MPAALSPTRCAVQRAQQAAAPPRCPKIASGRLLFPLGLLLLEVLLERRSGRDGLARVGVVPRLGVAGVRHATGADVLLAVFIFQVLYDKKGTYIIREVSCFLEPVSSFSTFQQGRFD